MIPSREVSGLYSTLTIKQMNYAARILDLNTLTPNNTLVNEIR